MEQLLSQQDIGVPDTMRSSRSRIISLSSYLGYEPHRPSREKKRFRKLAKACSKSLATWNDSKHSSTTETSTPASKGTPITYSPNANGHLSNSFTSRIFGGGGGAAACKKSSSQGDKVGLMFERNHENKSQGTGAGPDITIEKKLSVKPSSPSAALTEKLKGLNIESRMDKLANLNDRFGIFDDEPNTIGLNKYIIQKKSRPTTVQSNDRIISSTNLKPQEIHQLSKPIPGRRVVQLKNFSSFVGIKSVLAQVCGGPLERVAIIRSGSSSSQQLQLQTNYNQLKNNTLELWFLYPHDADSFMTFCSSGMFLINGFHYEPQWAPKHHQHKPHETYHLQPDESVSEQMINHGARRCLILKKYIPKRVKPSSKHLYPSPNSHLSELNIEEIKFDFTTFGKIIDVTPVISKKLCVAIHFFDVESAINAKKSFLDHSSGFYMKYREWTLWYGKDPAEKPCINI